MFGGAQSSLCQGDNPGADVSRRGLGSITSCCQLSLDFVTALIVLSKSHSFVLECCVRELCAHSVFVHVYPPFEVGGIEL